LDYPEATTALRGGRGASIDGAEVTSGSFTPFWTLGPDVSFAPKKPTHDESRR